MKEKERDRDSLTKENNSIVGSFAARKSEKYIQMNKRKNKRERERESYIS